MHVLLLGNSDIGRRRVLPAFARHGVGRVDIASRSRAGAACWPEGMTGTVYCDYHEAIRTSPAELVWISTVNSSHAELALTALDAGKHVVIDKPATTTLAEARALAERARQRGRVLAEATVYAYHPQIAAACKIFADIGSAPTQILAAFSYPPMPQDNFRNQPELGGGTLLDLGPYAVSIGRLFLDAAPEEVLCRHSAKDQAFGLLAIYPGNRSVAGQFGTATGYINRLILLGPKVALTMERAFTTTPDMVCRLSGSVDNQPITVEVPAADSFALFLGAVFEAMERGANEPFLTTMLADAECMERLRQCTP